MTYAAPSTRLRSLRAGSKGPLFHASSKARDFFRSLLSRALSKSIYETTYGLVAHEAPAIGGVIFSAKGQRGAGCEAVAAPTAGSIARGVLVATRLVST